MLIHSPLINLTLNDKLPLLKRQFYYLLNFIGFIMKELLKCHKNIGEFIAFKVSYCNLHYCV